MLETEASAGLLPQTGEEGEGAKTAKKYLPEPVFSYNTGHF